MRQSDGSEILGPNDPRNLVIGIITVSPNDDRQSVVNAIASQDKQGRDQIVLVLPAQNKSFKNAVDFAGLHQMAGELEAGIVLVAPDKSKVASLASRESFTVYHTLEELTEAEFPALEPDGAGEPSSDEEMEHTMAFPLEIPNSSVAPASAAEEETPRQTATQGEQDQAAQGEEDEVPTSPLSAPPVAVPPATSQTGEEEDEAPTSPELAVPVLDPQGAAAQAPAPVSVSGSNLPAVLPPNSGALVPSNTRLPVYYEPIEPPARRRSWRGLIITGVTVLVLICLGVLFYRPVLDLFFPPTATVTIVPDSQQVQHTYQITAVLGVPDPSKNQVDARALYADSQTQSRTVKATGQGHVDGLQARGELTFYNISSSEQTIQAGTVIFDANGLAVVTDQQVTLPALDATIGLSGSPVAAHTVNVGSAQNIPAYDFNSQPCCNGSVDVTNTGPFTGGQDQQSFTYVQQSDIDGVTQSLNATLTQQATMALQSQVRSNERPVSAPRCAPQVKSDRDAGARSSEVTVNVTTSCVGEVYDLQAVQVLAARKLSQDAASNPGPAYAPVGNTFVQVTQTVPGTHGDVLLMTGAAGVWAYQFTPAQRARLASLIAGKSAQDARALLLGQTGVHDATITLTGVGVTTVPGDQKRITINVNAVQGLHP
ncbi:MAG TPA: hypothetical protein VF458_12220 [Ktedonobacteraceae bacterium]